MKRQDVDEIIACLPQECSLYRYFKDYYALQLLGWTVGDGITLEHLKKRPFGPLLQKPLIRPLLALCGDSRLHAARVDSQSMGRAGPALPDDPGALGGWRLAADLQQRCHPASLDRLRLGSAGPA